MPTALEKLRGQILVAPYPDLEPHVKRGSFILVSTNLDLAEVALKIETNDTAYMSGLIESGLLVKSTEADLKDWRRDKRFFKFLIVQPFVVAQFVILPPASDPKDLN
ncbi:MAG: DUF2288 family protein [Bdellovibrionota bacterium]